MIGILCGVFIGFALGLTGGGGSIFAVPMLIYGLHVPIHQAVPVSLAAVGITSMAGALTHLHNGVAEWRVGVAFGVSGMAGAPVGAWVTQYLPPVWLLGMFALLMFTVAFRMLRKRSTVAATAVRAAAAEHVFPDSAPHWGLKNTALIVLAGTLTGALSGLFGVGGGFLIVPVLLGVVKLPIQRAVATSLLIITLVSAAGVVAHELTGDQLNWPLIAEFACGGLLGMIGGIALSQKLAGPTLQRIFAIFIILVGLYMLFRDVLLWHLATL